MMKTQMVINTLKGFSAKKLCELWEESENQTMNSELAMVRGWIMDELESKDAKRFDSWIENDGSPAKYFI